MEKQWNMEVPADMADASEFASAVETSGARPTVKDFVQLAKPGILISNMITAFGGFWLAAKGNVEWMLLLWMSLGTILVMASGCVLNNYLDRDMDSKMSRTRNRITAKGNVSPKAVLIYGLTLGVAGLSILGLLVNPLTALLGITGLFVYVWVYTAWLKRTSVWSTMVGGVSGAMPPVIGYCAVTNTMDMGALILFLILFLWQPPHFWALGIRRKEEYREAGFPLLPVVRGNYVTKMAMVRYIVMLVPVSLLLYLYGYAGIYYLIASAIMGLGWLYMCLRGFKPGNDEVLWARRMFVYSINYLTLMFLVMVLDTVKL